MQKSEKSIRLANLPPLTQFGRKRLLPLLKSDDDYLSPDYMRTWAIKCYPLDFYSGIPLDSVTKTFDTSAETFTRLVAYDTVENDLNRIKPWICPFDGDTRDITHWDKDLDDWWHAYHIIKMLSFYLTNHYKGNDLTWIEPTLGIIDDTDWELSE